MGSSISCSDIFHHLPIERLEALQAKYADATDGDPVEQLATQAGHRMLEILADLEPEDLACVCEGTGLDPSELARLCAPPRTRGDCERGLRPCPYRSCRYHVRGGPEPVCALDIADDGGATQDVVAAAMGVTRQRVAQVEREAFASIRRTARRVQIAGLPSALHNAVQLSEVDGSPEAGRVPARRNKLYRKLEVVVDG